MIAGNSSYQMLLTSYQNALSNPLYDRCLILTQLLQDSPLKELQYVFPSLVEAIFGFRTGMDWGLLSLEKNLQQREFESLRRFLALDGPVLRLVHKLCEDFSPKFEFPIACLPHSSQKMLQEGKVPPLFANKLQGMNAGTFPSTLQLNAFEFYFFNFTYFIVNPSIRNATSLDQTDVLYSHLLEDYLFSLLPTDNRAVPLYQPTSSPQHSPIQTFSLSSNYGSPHTMPDFNASLHSPMNGRPDFLSPQKQKPSLLKKGTVLMVSSPGSNSPHGHSPAESWRSETFILILKEMYLNQTLNQPRGSSVFSQRTFDSSPFHAWIVKTFHVWMVRIMVKHLHFFFNSTLSSNQLSGHGQIMIDSLGRLKSLGMTQLIQKEMYCFLKSTFDHWPLDQSFRIPLETYLSYIQPWRYVRCDIDSSVWHKFINENLFFYTTIFQQILKRFLRMDLSCPKNAFMLFRLTKVICTSELRDLLMQAERKSLSKPSALGMSYQHSPEKFPFQKNSELEIASSSHVPLFSEPVFLLVTHILSSIRAAIEKNQQNPINDVLTSRSFVHSIYGWFQKSDDDIRLEESSPTDLRKVSSNLEMSSKSLCNFFREVSHLNASMISSPTSSSFLNSQYETGEGSKLHDLTTLERVQLFTRRKSPEIAYHDNPDLQPVRTFEVGFLVHFLNDMSMRLNEKYYDKIQEYYYQDNMVGKISRRLLSPPLTYVDVKKSKDMVTYSRNLIHLPARVNLRVLSNKQLIGYFLAYVILFYWLGYNPLFSMFLLIVLFVFGLVLSALIYPVPSISNQN